MNFHVGKKQLKTALRKNPMSLVRLEPRLRGLKPQSLTNGIKNLFLDTEVVLVFTVYKLRQVRSLVTKCSRKIYLMLS